MYTSSWICSAGRWWHGEGIVADGKGGTQEEVKTASELTS